MRTGRNGRAVAHSGYLPVKYRSEDNLPLPWGKGGESSASACASLDGWPTATPRAPPRSAGSPRPQPAGPVRQLYLQINEIKELPGRGAGGWPRPRLPGPFLMEIFIATLERRGGWRRATPPTPGAGQWWDGIGGPPVTPVGGGKKGRKRKKKNLDSGAEIADSLRGNWKHSTL